MTRVLLAAPLLVALSCASAATPPPVDPDPERARAALATLVVRNETTRQLDILYRTVGSEGEVGVGRVEPNASTEVAPVPAAEPLILIARTARGTELVLPPRTFEIDGTWLWLIPPNARFVRSPTDHAP